MDNFFISEVRQIKIDYFSIDNRCMQDLQVEDSDFDSSINGVLKHKKSDGTHPLML